MSVFDIKSAKEIDVEAAGLDIKNPVDGLPKEIEPVNVGVIGIGNNVNNYGIKETVELLRFLCLTGKAVKDSKEDDGKITVGDSFKFFDPARAAIPAFCGIDKVVLELKDTITEEEKNILIQTVIESGALQGKAEKTVVKGIALAVSIKEFFEECF